MKRLLKIAFLLLAGAVIAFLWWQTSPRSEHTDSTATVATTTTHALRAYNSADGAFRLQ